jgi:hypothetical protein
MDDNGDFDIENTKKPFMTVTEVEQQETEDMIAMWKSRLKRLQREGGDSQDRRLRVGSLVSGYVPNSLARSLARSPAFNS